MRASSLYEFNEGHKEEAHVGENELGACTL
jgi:hypothetical protein